MISQVSCFPSREIKIKVIPDYCILHTPLDDELDYDVIDYWTATSKLISEKNKSGGLKTPAEKFAEILINNAGINDKKYYDKKCDELNN